jgi:PAS domain S-box-containing protein
VNFVRKSLRNKLIVILSTVSLGSIVIIGVLSYVNARNSLQNTAMSALEAIGDLKTQTIELFFQERSNDIKVTQDYFNVKTNLSIVSKHAGDRTNPEYISAKNMLDSQLKKFQIVYDYADVMLVNSEGKIVYVTEESHYKTDLDKPLPDPAGKAFEEGKKGVYFSDIFAFGEEPGYHEMLITAPIHDFNGEFAGVIALEIDMDPIYRLIQDRTGLGETGETLVGKIIGNEAVFLNPLRHDPDAALNRKVSLGSDEAIPLQQAVQGLRGIGLSVDYRGEEVIAHWHHIPITGWGLVAKIDQREAFVSIISFRNYIILFSISLIFLLVGVAFWISKKIVDPLNSLNKFTDRVSKGNFSDYPEVKTEDEIGQLAASFIDMAQKLEKLIMKLEGEIIDRKQIQKYLKENVKETQFLVKLLNDSSQPFVAASAVGQLTKINPAFCKLTGYTEKEILANDTWNETLTPPEWLDYEAEIFQKLINTGEPQRFNKEYVRKDGTRISVELLMHQSVNEKGKLEYVYGFITDITQRKQIDEELAKHREHLEELVKERTAELEEIAKEMEDAQQSLTYLVEDVNESRVELELKTEELNFSLKEAKDARDKIGAILKSVADGLIVTDNSNHVIHMNNIAEDLFKVSLEKIINRPIDYVIEEKTLRERVKSTLNKKIDYQFDFELAGVDSDKPRIFRARTSVIKDKEGKANGIITIFHDVSHEREVDRMKTEFISTAAHELRTPLTSIQGFSEILLQREDLDSKEKNKFLTYINRQAENLAVIINDLLDLSRIESGQSFVLEKEPCSFHKIADEVVDIFKRQSERHRFKIEFINEPEYMHFDKDKIFQVFRNLISNSVKYSLDGGLIQIKGDIVKDYYQITVQDEGIGMSPDQVNKIFDKFYRADASNTAIEGTGLGMSIVKYIVEAHGGKVWVESELNRGTIVFFTIPCMKKV